MSIGMNIKRLRERAGMTQVELAEKMGLSSKTISSWEIDRTEPKMGKVEQLTRIFGCLKTDIIGNDTEPEDKEPGFEEALQVFTRSRKNLTREQRMELARKILEESDDE